MCIQRVNAPSSIRAAAALSLCLVLGVLLANGSAEGNPRLSPEGFVLVDGQPRLVIGSYELPADDAGLKRLADAGFNLVRVPNAAGLDRAKTQGLFGWLCISPALGENDEAGKQRIAAMVEANKDHPALLAWELPDEALWNVWYKCSDWIHRQQAEELRAQIAKNETLSAEKKQALVEQVQAARWTIDRGLYAEAEAKYDAIYRELGTSDPHPELRLSRCEGEATALAAATARGCEVLRQVDPRHVIWWNHAPRNTRPDLARFNQSVDVAGCDIYPVPEGVGHSDLADRSLASVGAYTDRMRAAAPGKANWMVLQGFGWRDIDPHKENQKDPNVGRRPRWGETRFMAYDAIVHGSNGILYWGVHAIENDSPLWSDLLRVARELRALEAAIVSPAPAVRPVATVGVHSSSFDPEDGPRLMLRQVGDDWVLIAVNEHRAGIPFTISGLAPLEGRTLIRLGTDEEHVVQDGQFRDGMSGYAVHVYATSRRFEPAK